MHFHISIEINLHACASFHISYLLRLQNLAFTCGIAKTFFGPAEIDVLTPLSSHIVIFTPGLTNASVSMTFLQAIIVDEGEVAASDA